MIEFSTHFFAFVKDGIRGGKRKRRCHLSHEKNGQSGTCKPRSYFNPWSAVKVIYLLKFFNSNNSFLFILNVSVKQFGS